ncbi:TetR/AcrR family transcriptional regulator [Paenibacillus spongiae]|uniref:TetR/AcrR family transcriptional regulator n=1 Tax=Paenibacillus spongiae TaxID=2909671 RepID=A0ABY5S4P3_9BACL|nr:TetR/AcrR family transcriptional regulator [Paenibacillus spongiae]UVI28463.1 TetR/AcrR family transcriptional regulator [Paenibacillus spongiae]
MKSIESSTDERKDQIKRAALKVFAKHGIDGTKMSAIAAEAGISQGLSYRYFSSKEEIFTILVQEALEEAHAAVRNVVHLPGSPREQFRAFTLIMLDESHKEYFLLLQHANASKEVPEQAKQLLERYSSNDMFEHLVPILKKGQQLGEFSEGDPHRLLFLYFSVITGLMLQDISKDDINWHQEVDVLLRILTKAKEMEIRR